MVDQQMIMVCRSCRAFWPEGTAPACTDPDHQHDRFEVHRHRDRVRLPDGTAVTAVSFDAGDPYRRDRRPHFGLYLDQRWQPPWPHDHLAWPDFGVPEDRQQVLAAIQDVLQRARSGAQVEIGCLGGHGRTGTALTCLAALAGAPVDDAVGYIRRHYCPQAVETADQEEFVGLLIGDQRS